MKYLLLPAMVLVAALLVGASPQAAPGTVALVFTTGPAWDTSKSPNAQAQFGSHSANLRRLREAGVIVAGGRFGAYGLILVRAPGIDSAHAMLLPDSSIVVGTFKVEVTRWSTIYEGTITR